MINPLTDLKVENDFVDSLPEKHFYYLVQPTPLPNPHLVSFNTQAAKSLLDLELNLLDKQHVQQILEHFSGAKLLPNGKPVSCAYSGFQFGQFAGPLGDGRAVCLGEVKNQNGGKWEVQLKGSGRTPYSRFGDGLCVLRSAIREYLCSEAMHALGIPTTRALCIVGSVERKAKRERIETTAVMTRLAPSHIRFGTFEHFHYKKQFDMLKLLADYTIDRYFSHLSKEPNVYLQFYKQVVQDTAKLIATWQAYGFCHGVLNTDNMSILSITLDYGPYAFMEEYNPNYVCNCSDDEARYSYKQQPAVGKWNLEKLAVALSSIIPYEESIAVLAQYETIYEQHYMDLMRHKLGLIEKREQEDTKLLEKLIAIMYARSVDWTIFWRRLCSLRRGEQNPVIRELFAPTQQDFDVWQQLYEERLKNDGPMEGDQQRRIRMEKVNPKFILRNYLAFQAIQKAQQFDFSEIENLLTLLRKPFDEQPQFESYAAKAPEWARFIGNSCSS